VLAGGQRRFHQGVGGLDPTDDLDHDADLGIIQDLLRVLRKPLGRQTGGLALGWVDVRRLAQFDRHAGLAAQIVCLFDEKLHDTAPHGATADDPHSKLAGRHDWFS
jgi:hypothetical protein